MSQIIRSQIFLRWCLQCLQRASAEFWWGDARKFAQILHLDMLNPDFFRLRGLFPFFGAGGAQKEAILQPDLVAQCFVYGAVQRSK